MAMGKKPSGGQQQEMWVPAENLPRSPGHPFYERLNRVLEKAGLDAFVEGRRVGNGCNASGANSWNGRSPIISGRADCAGSSFVGMRMSASDCWSM